MPLSWIALNSVPGLGTARLTRLLDHYGTPDKVFEAPTEELEKVAGLPKNVAAAVHDESVWDVARRQLDTAEKIGATILTLGDSRYPVYLREIFAPPPVIYVLGDLAVLRQHAVAMVGSRTPTPYGRQAAAIITRDLVQHQFTITSGLARGIDTVAHEAALDNGGTTIAVLGTGIDTIYPASNKALSARICNHGLLLSEFSFETPPETFNFPRRNRIISGLSAATVVVEAGEKSGSLITARYALQQGREVAAVPGPITSLLSRGTFDLIRAGAIPVRSGHELAEELKMVKLPGLSGNASVKQELPHTIFTNDEQRIFDTLSTDPMRIDILAGTLNLSVSELFVVLLNLELKGLVQQCSGQQFIRV